MTSKFQFPNWRSKNVASAAVIKFWACINGPKVSYNPPPLYLLLVSNVEEINISFFAHNFVIFLNFSKIPGSVKNNWPCSTILLFWKFFISFNFFFIQLREKVKLSFNQGENSYIVFSVSEPAFFLRIQIWPVKKVDPDPGFCIQAGWGED